MLQPVLHLHFANTSRTVAAPAGAAKPAAECSKASCSRIPRDAASQPPPTVSPAPLSLTCSLPLPAAPPPPPVRFGRRGAEGEATSMGKRRRRSRAARGPQSARVHAHLARARCSAWLIPEPAATSRLRAGWGGSTSASTPVELARGELGGTGGARARGWSAGATRGAGRRRWSSRVGLGGAGGSSRRPSPPSPASPSPPAPSSGRRRRRPPPAPASNRSREATTARRCARGSAPPLEAVLLCATGASAYCRCLRMRDCVLLDSKLVWKTFHQYI
jgi:hypothetical protein